MPTMGLFLDRVCHIKYIYIYIIRARVKHRKTRLSEDALKDPDSTHEK